MNIPVGTKVRSLIEFSYVPKGAIGWVIEDYQEGVLIAWEVEGWKPELPLSEYRIDKMAAIDPRCPLRDGFAKDELEYLEIIKE